MDRGEVGRSCTPRGFPREVAGGPGVQKKPKGQWSKQTTPDGAEFFVKADSGEKSWTLPRETRTGKEWGKSIKTSLEAFGKSAPPIGKKAIKDEERMPWNRIDNRLVEGGHAHAEVDLSKAVLHTAAELDSALSAWRSRIAPITNSPKAGVEVKFYAGIQTMQAFHQRVRAMGIEALPEGSPTEGAVGVVAPYVTFGGDPAQPCAFVLWRLAPEEKTTLHWNTRKFYVSARGKKGHIEPRIETLVTFFGPPVAVSSSAARHAPGRAQKQCSPAAAKGSGGIRAMLQAAAK